MGPTVNNDYGWGSYYDERDVMSGMGGTMAGLSYAPDLGPVGSGADGSYYPRDTSADAAALNFLGFLPDPFLAKHIGTTGSQRGDMSSGAGAWDPAFQTAVRDFQGTAGLAADGWIGPKTRAGLAAAVGAKNAREAPNAPPQPIPPNLIPGLPSTPGASPAAPSAQASDTIMGIPKTAAIVGGIALAAGAVYAAWKWI
jgi:hypothetical protein